MLIYNVLRIYNIKELNCLKFIIGIKMNTGIRSKIIIEKPNFNMNAFLMTSNLFNLFISMNCHIETIAPVLNFGFIGTGKENDMRLITINDYGSLFLFIKTVPQKTKQHILKHTCYCIAKRFCSYVHYESGNVIEDNIFELYKLEPDYVNEKIKFTYGDEEVNIENVGKDEYDNIKCYINNVEVEPRISSIIDQDLNVILGYYIKRENIEYVHCFMNEQEDYEKDVDYDALSDIIETGIEEELEIDEITLSLGQYLIGTKGGSDLSNYIGIYSNRNEKTKLKFPKPQDVSIHVATYFSQVLAPWIFNEISRE